MQHSSHSRLNSQDRAWPVLGSALFAFVCVLPSVSLHAEMLAGKVVGISDGDTLTLLADNRQIKIRVAGVDAPEKAQPFGQRSKAGLSDCAYGKQANIEWTKLDRYGRTIGKVLVGGRDCGLAQVVDGLAWHYKAYQREQAPDDRVSYARAELDARAARKGLWEDDQPQPPWDFRHSAKKTSDR